MTGWAADDELLSRKKRDGITVEFTAHAPRGDSGEWPDGHPIFTVYGSRDGKEYGYEVVYRMEDDDSGWVADRGHVLKNHISHVWGEDVAATTDEFDWTIIDPTMVNAWARAIRESDVFKRLVDNYNRGDYSSEP